MIEDTIGENPEAHLDVVCLANPSRNRADVVDQA
jgi:hypothetical protein